MAKLLSVVVLAMLFSGALIATAQQSGAQQSQTPKINKVSPPYTSPGSGKEMYNAYCAVCHGTAGKGDGPAAPAMKTPPTDLTQLSSRNGGKFPEVHVTDVLNFGTSTPAHGSADMPIWGNLMRERFRSSEGPAMTQHRIHNITDYIRKLQK